MLKSVGVQDVVTLTTMQSQLSFSLNASSPINATKCSADLDQPEQLYVNLSTFWYCFLALITTIGLLVSLISNMIIIYLFTRNPSNIIAVNLSLSDLLYCTQWPSVIYCSLTQSTWILEHKLVCQSFGFITVSTALASILTVLAMSVERAIVIKYSIHAKNRFTIRSAWLIIVIIWLVSLCFCLPPLFGKFNRYTLDPSKTSCTLDYLSRQTNYKLYILVLYVAFWIAPTVIISISYFIIIATFKKSSLSLKEVEKDEPENLSFTMSSPQPQTTTSGFVRSKRRLRDSIRLNTFIGSFHNRIGRQKRRRGDDEVRRASIDVVDLERISEHNKLRPETSIHGNDKSRTFKRVASSSLLLRPVTELESNFNIKLLPQVNPIKRLKRFSRGSLRSCRVYTSNVVRSNTLDELHSNSCNILSKIPTNFRVSKSLNNSLTLAANSQLTRTVLQFRLAKMSFYLILLWLVSWTPIASLAMLNSVLKCHSASATAVFMASTMTKLGPAFDVFIYGISHPKIKSKFKQIIKWLLMLGSISVKLQSSNLTNNNSITSNRVNNKK